MRGMYFIVKLNNKKTLKILIIIILIIVLVFLGYIIFIKIQKNNFKKMLQDNDATNYELVETVNGEETVVYVRDKILLMKEDNTTTWVNELESKRIIFDDEYHTVIIDENDESLKVNSLNYTYLNDYFDNSNQSFKFLGEENGFYKLQFKEKGNKRITLFYINKKTKLVEKIVQNAGNFELVTELKVEKNVVSKQEVELPNLEGYRVYNSVNSK